MPRGMRRSRRRRLQFSKRGPCSERGGGGTTREARAACKGVRARCARGARRTRRSVSAERHRLAAQHPRPARLTLELGLLSVGAHTCARANTWPLSPAASSASARRLSGRRCVRACARTCSYLTTSRQLTPYNACSLRPTHAPYPSLQFSPLATKTGAVNLGQGFPNWETPRFVKDAIVQGALCRAGGVRARGVRRPGPGLVPEPGNE